MNTYFKILLDKYNQAETDAEKEKRFVAMFEYANAYREDYSIYDMDMYVELYKCSTTPYYRNCALEHMDSISTDGLLYLEEIIENFMEFTLLKDYLDPGDVKKFDEIFGKVLDFFLNRLEEIKTFDFNYPVESIEEAENNLKQVVDLILGTQMNELESYKKAIKC